MSDYKVPIKSLIMICISRCLLDWWGLWIVNCHKVCSMYTLDHNRLLCQISKDCLEKIVKGFSFYYLWSELIELYNLGLLDIIVKRII